jgi:hypothetical protein
MPTISPPTVRRNSTNVGFLGHFARREQMQDLGCHSLGPWVWVVLVAEGSPCHTPRSARKAVLDELMLKCSEQCLQAVKLLQVRALRR